MNHFFPCRITRGLVAAGILLWASNTRADDVYYEAPLLSLKLTAGELPKQMSNEGVDRLVRRGGQLLKPYVVIDGDAEAYLASTASWESLWRIDNETLHLRGTAGKDIAGNLYLPNEDWTGLKQVKFVVPASEASPVKKSTFLDAKNKYYLRLVDARVPGGSWFRYQARIAQAAMAGKSLTEFEADARRQVLNSNSETQFEDTFEIFSGGRAVSENLQLDRMMPSTAPDEPTIDISSLKGITVAEMDWGPLVKDIHPQTDPLAEMLPSDQYALLFPTFQSMVRMMDEAELNGTPILDTVQPRSESARSRERYEKQLCLSVNALSRLLGDQVVSEVAFTGSDPYLRTGTDVAILFEAKNVAVLMAHIATQQAAAAKSNPECKTLQETESGVKYAAVVSPDRSVCSYIAQINNTVVVTNSLVQLKRIVETTAKKSESLASLPEYTFFRNRYQRGGDETGLLIVTDKAIRRWSSAKWRIATSRRTRAAAIMAHYQAENMPEIVAGKVEPHVVKTILQVPDLGTLRLDKNGVSSSTYGMLEFQTPIAELNIAKVTKSEADTYERWRSGYQQNWSGFFDPIAVSFSVRDNRLSADVTVMPLIDSSQYQGYIDIVSGAELKPTSGDPHAGSLFHSAMAVNIRSNHLKWASNFLEGPTGASLLGWLGESISIYADPDPFWGELAAALKSADDKSPIHDEASQKFFEENVHRLPVAFTAEVANSLKLTFFLTGARAYIEQTAPGMLNWESLKHNEQPYVKITAKPAARNTAPFAERLAIYYAATPEMLVITLNEDLLKRSLDRQAARQKAAGEKVAKTAGNTSVESKENVSKAADPTSPTDRPWLGKSMALQIDRKVLDLFESVFGRREFQSYMQARSWSNIPILNEWKRRYPEREPVALHQQLWQTTPTCPGGGKYVWNEKFQTMESTVYGHPGEPKTGETVPLPLATARALDFGLTFENKGLRAKLDMLREPATTKSASR